MTVHQKRLLSSFMLNGGFGVCSFHRGYAQDIRDVKPPVADSSPTFIYFLIGVVCLLLGFVLWKYLIIRKTPGNVSLITPREKALNHLDSLRKRPLTNQQQYDAFFSEISYLIRVFIEESFTIHAPEMTSEEFLTFIRDKSILPLAHKDLLQEFLRTCDLVKFASYTPSQEESQKAFALAKRFIEESTVSAAPAAV